MICSNCNKEVPDSSLFCNFCGTQIKTQENILEDYNVKDLKQEPKKVKSSVIVSDEKKKHGFPLRIMITTVIILSTILLIIGQMTEYTFSYTHYDYLRHMKKDVDGNNALIKSVIKNDLPNTIRILDLGVDPDIINNQSESALLIAVRNSNIEIVKNLLDKGASTEIKDSNLDTPLLIASSQGDSEVCEMLVDYGANMDVLNSKSEDPLKIAVKRGNQQLVEVYIKNGIDINKKDTNNDSPLLLAAKLKQTEIFKLLLDNGASITDKDANDDSIFHILGRNKDELSMNLLIKKRKTDLLSFRFQKDELTGSGFTSVSFIHCLIPDDKIYDFYAENGIKTLYDKDGNKVYEGEINNGRITGYGTAYTTDNDYGIEPNQIIYEGNWKDGIWDGKGKSYWVKNTLDALKSSTGDDENAIILYNGIKNTVFYDTIYVNGYRNGYYTRYFSDGSYNDSGVARDGNNIYNDMPVKLKPSIGMSKKEAESSSWGKPQKINKTTTANGVREQWVYDNYDFLYFENGVLVAIQD